MSDATNPIGTKFPELFAMLGAQFEPCEVKLRPGSGGRQLSYVTAATVANRLDNVVGPDCWEFDLKPWGNDALIGTLSIRLPDGTVVKKSNVGGKASMDDAADDAKSAASDCLKRCATLFGIARYLSFDGVPTYVAERTGLDGPALPLSEQAEHNVRDQAAGPARAEPAAPARRDDRQAPERAPAVRGNGQGDAPRTGKALFAWTKDMEQKHEVQLLKYLNSYGKIQEWPARMIDWTPETVALAYTEACRKLRFVEQGRGDAYEQALSN